MDTAFSSDCGSFLKSKDGCSSRQLSKISAIIFLVFLTHVSGNDI